MANGIEMFLASKKSAVFFQYRRAAETQVLVNLCGRVPMICA